MPALWGTPHLHRLLRPPRALPRLRDEVRARARILGRGDDHHHDLHLRPVPRPPGRGDDHHLARGPLELAAGLTIGANLVLPVLVFPRAKTPGVGMEMSWHPLEPAEIEAANRHVAARSR